MSKVVQAFGGLVVAGLGIFTGNPQLIAGGAALFIDALLPADQHQVKMMATGADTEGRLPIVYGEARVLRGGPAP